MTDGPTAWSFFYDENGMRTHRIFGTTTYKYVYNGSQLVEMTVGDDTLHFTYGLLGPTTVTWNGTTYYYALNAQGDVVGIFDGTGNPVVSYTWDNAWGYNPMPEGVMASTLGTLNPLRYRGYVYDTETGLYYLESRYYDPEIGRFINADAFVATGQGMLGNNMFAYCNNNPVNLADPSGTVCCALFGDNQLFNLGLRAYSGSGGSSVSARRSSMSTKGPMDTNDPEVVFKNLDEYGRAYYNGVPVFRANLGEGGGFSYGIIVLDDDYTYNDWGIKVLNHEYGHRLHMNEIGIINYTVTTAIPSLIFAIIPNDHYYSWPWERIADIYGGVTRDDYLPGSREEALKFWMVTKLISEVTGGI